MAPPKGDHSIHQKTLGLTVKRAWWIPHAQTIIKPVVYWYLWGPFRKKALKSIQKSLPRECRSLEKTSMGRAHATFMGRMEPSCMKVWGEGQNASKSENAAFQIVKMALGFSVNRTWWNPHAQTLINPVFHWDVWAPFSKLASKSIKKHYVYQ